MIFTLYWAFGLGMATLGNLSGQHHYFTVGMIYMALAPIIAKR